jgi:Ca2+-binding EF-hand superfamily protein
MLQRRVDRIMELADINEDGKLDFDEFVYAIKTLEVR